MEEKEKKVCPGCQGRKVISGTCTCDMEWRGNQRDKEWDDCICSPEQECPVCQGTGHVEE